MPTLFDPIALGALNASNRTFMAPLTRARATRDHVPTPIMADYYAQRATAGLIIGEATGISRQAVGWPYAPGLWSAEQVKAWMPVTQAVHDKGGLIFAQLWHMGRMAHSAVTGRQPVSASATAMPGDAHTYEGKMPFEIARPLATEEIPSLISDYVSAASNAMAAGFDGVQIHAANGQLLDQFLRDGTNARTDEYGGSIDNRVRLLRLVTQAVADEVGADRTAVRLSPNGESYGVDDSNPAPLFTAAAEMLNAIGIAFLELREPGPDGTFGATDVPRLSPQIRRHFKGALVLNSDYDVARAKADLDSGLADAISFGRPFLANPDLVWRLRHGAPLTKDEMATYYSQGAEGYTDYETLMCSKAFD
ncbi:2,4-dienoyl-CoA reductase-like NADH-dependent reductase (Old Yellow Enzyme family) [Variovorax paradoxus]|uniref:2,4-dienoyl-CoA reductase-like NADH-dependent reductase (Old Yellow Enzyme family) n=1 Tax=Variovorax paradoxus TaxID=34073 RepID=A0AAE4BZY5_VARPD|nr:alkene reductase [Variovorax paradoxus]MDP9965400.1 2,4-dienoyl-CoA reductase-like NADH-dependent reductase (Old Yellow Enzyme family) [Variovorax paradoxus]MDR6428659.1 2,4-dienoyl-CoA reductase-like NADH-dependent reductase (Old Yellow Enzyme family) [Variovorax paradoxus]MDR6456014.1 2,4-dienoyl-CoA reductase-like NADH-dependent reductase (Old Yellow Enzyme family) [Variovorax paradoxus]